MGQGIEGIVSDSEIPKEVFEFHRRYREFLSHNLQAYVFDNDARNVYLIVVENCDEDLLREYAKDVDYSFGIMRRVDQNIKRLGKYKTFAEVDKKIPRAA